MSDANANLETPEAYLPCRELEDELQSDAIISTCGFMETAVDEVTRKLERYGSKAEEKMPELSAGVTVATAIVYLADRIGLLADEMRDGLRGISEAIRGNHDRKGQS